VKLAMTRDGRMLRRWSVVFIALAQIGGGSLAWNMSVLKTLFVVRIMRSTQPFWGEV
jgi:hypothetical protein